MTFFLHMFYNTVIFLQICWLTSFICWHWNMKAFATTGLQPPAAGYIASSATNLYPSISVRLLFENLCRLNIRSMCLHVILSDIDVKPCLIYLFITCLTQFAIMNISIQALMCTPHVIYPCVADKVNNSFWEIHCIQLEYCRCQLQSSIQWTEFHSCFAAYHVSV